VGRLEGRRGWPRQHGTFHALRHFFATTLITNHAEPQEVQRLLRHKTLRITLETHVHWWPKRDRRRGVVGAVLAAANTRPPRAGTTQDQT
jgi:integrase